MTTAEKTQDMPLTLPDGLPEPGDGPSKSTFATASALPPAELPTEQPAEPPMESLAEPPKVRPSARERVRPVFPGSDTIESRIPAPLHRLRPSPILDPVLRLRISRAAKWLFLFAILATVAYLPAYFADAAGSLGLSAARLLFPVTTVAAATAFAAVIATGLPRLIAPGLFGRWREAVEALRDWLVVGVVTGVLYGLGVWAARAIGFGPAGGVDTLAQWMAFRLPILVAASVAGILSARALAIRGESLVGRGWAATVTQIVVQAALIAGLEHPMEAGVRYVATLPGIAPAIGGSALILALIATGIIVWAISGDSGLAAVRRRRGASGISDAAGGAPVELTLTVIGGRESGKTVLMAGAFREWTTEKFGDLTVAPATPRGGESESGVANLEEVSNELYNDHQFPVGTISTQNLPFDLSLGSEKVARFSFLDYPGGAIAGKVADEALVREFWERVDDTDGIVLIADMSYVRRARRDADWLDVQSAYRAVMRRLMERNGKRRVVPVALVLTKCDEYIDRKTGHIDLKSLNSGLQTFRYDDLEAEWRDLAAKRGPGFAEFTTWITSAITYSRPQTDADGRPDRTKPFEIVPGPPSIMPTGCAAPLLWITSKVMRWNVTLFYDISTFLFGSSPRVRRRVDSILELERIAEEHAGRA